MGRDPPAGLMGWIIREPRSTRHGDVRVAGTHRIAARAPCMRAASGLPEGPACSPLGGRGQTDPAAESNKR